jgi:hypothetical protein
MTLKEKFRANFETRKMNWMIDEYNLSEQLKERGTLHTLAHS